MKTSQKFKKWIADQDERDFLLGRITKEEKRAEIRERMKEEGKLNQDFIDEDDLKRAVKPADNEIIEQCISTLIRDGRAVIIKYRNRIKIPDIPEACYSDTEQIEALIEKLKDGIRE